MSLEALQASVQFYKDNGCTSENALINARADAEREREREREEKAAERNLEILRMQHAETMRGPPDFSPDFSTAINSSLVLHSDGGKGKAVAISKKQALCTLHNLLPLDSKVTLIDYQGRTLDGKVSFVRYEQSSHDIGVITLENGLVFDSFLPLNETGMDLGREIYVVGLDEEILDSSTTAFVRKCVVEKIEKSAFGSSLFQSTYYSEKGFSGAGVITTCNRGVLQVVGVHVGSHDATKAHEEGEAVKKAKPTLGDRLDDLSDNVSSLRSDVHGHHAYCLICEACRVPDLLTYLNNSAETSIATQSTSSTH